MPNTPIILATVNITSRGLDGSNVLKTFEEVKAINFDFSKGMVNIVDSTGSFFFSLTAVVTLTYVVAGNTTSIVIL